MSCLGPSGSWWYRVVWIPIALSNILILEIGFFVWMNLSAGLFPCIVTSFSKVYVFVFVVRFEGCVLRDCKLCLASC